MCPIPSYESTPHGPSTQTVPQILDPAIVTGTRLIQPGEDPEVDRLIFSPRVNSRLMDQSAETSDLFVPTPMPHNSTFGQRDPATSAQDVEEQKLPRARLFGLATGALVLSLLAGAASQNVLSSDSKAAEQAITDITVETPVPETPTPSPSVDPNASAPIPDPNASLAPTPVDPNVSPLPAAPEVVPVAPPAPEKIANPQLVLTFTTQNLYSGKNKQAAKAVENIINTSDVAGFQETQTWVWKDVAPRLLQCGEACPNEGYYPQDPETGKMSTNLLVWDETKLAVIEQDFDYLNTLNESLEKAAGGDDISQRLLPHATFQQIRPPLLENQEYADEPIHVVVWVNHYVATIEEDGAANNKNKIRRSIYASQKQNTLNAIKLNQLEHPYQKRVDIILEDGNFDVIRNEARHNDTDPTNDDLLSPLNTYGDQLGFVCANLQPGAPRTGTLPKKGVREVDTGWYKSNLPIQLTNFTYEPLSGENDGSHGADHIGVTFTITVG